MVIGNPNSRNGRYSLLLTTREPSSLSVTFGSRRLYDSNMSGKLNTTITAESRSHPPDSSETSESLNISAKPPPQLTYDIEHIPVKNDPRAWSPLRKVSLSFLSRLGQLIPSMLERQSSPHRISSDDCFTGC